VESNRGHALRFVKSRKHAVEQTARLRGLDHESRLSE
jgi:hypothetical protein